MSAEIIDGIIVTIGGDARPYAAAVETAIAKTKAGTADIAAKTQGMSTALIVAMKTQVAMYNQAAKAVENYAMSVVKASAMIRTAQASAASQKRITQMGGGLITHEGGDGGGMIPTGGGQRRLTDQRGGMILYTQSTGMAVAATQKVTRAWLGAETAASRLMRVVRGLQATMAKGWPAFTASLNKITKSFHEVSGAAMDATSKITRFAAIGGAAVVTSSAAVAGAIAKTGIAYLAQKEQAEIAFGTLLKNEEAGKSFYSQIQKMADVTPFETEGLSKSTQLLMAMGFEAEKTLPIMTKVGDAVSAMGRGEETIHSVVLALGQMKNAGRVNAQDMNQLTAAGISGWKYLAEASGKSIAQIRKQSESGMLSSKNAVDVILAGMARDFGGSMEKQSKTWIGMLSTLRDMTKREAGTILEPLFGSLKRAMFTLFGDAKNFSRTIAPITEALRTQFTVLGQRLEAFLGRDKDKMIKQLASGLTELVSISMKLGASFLDALPGMQKFASTVWDVIKPVVEFLSTSPRLAVVLAAFPIAQMTGATTALAALLPLLMKIASQAALALVGLGGIPGIIIAIGVAATMAASAWSNWYFETSKLNDSLKESLRLTDAIKSNYEKGTSKTLADADAIGDPGKKKEFLATELATASKNVDGYTKHISAAKKELDRISKTGYFANPEKDAQMEAAKQEIKELESLHTASLARVNAIKAAMDKPVDAAASLTKGVKSATSAIDQITASLEDYDMLADDLITRLQEEAETFNVLGTEKRAQILLSKDLSDEKRAELEASLLLVKSLKEEEKTRKLAEGHKNDVINLQAQIATFGQGARAAHIYAMEVKKAGTDEIAAAKKADKELTALEAQKKSQEKTAQRLEHHESTVNQLKAEIATFGQGAHAAEIFRMRLEGVGETEIKVAEDHQKQLKGLTDHKKLMDAATHTNEQFAPPAQRLAERQKELKEQFDAGLITLETYNHALKDVWNQANKEYKVEFKVGGLEAVEHGSAQAIAMLDAFNAHKMSSGMGLGNSMNPRQQKMAQVNAAKTAERVANKAERAGVKMTGPQPWEIAKAKGLGAMEAQIKRMQRDAARYDSPNAQKRRAIMLAKSGMGGLNSGGLNKRQLAMIEANKTKYGKNKPAAPLAFAPPPNVKGPPAGADGGGGKDQALVYLQQIAENTKKPVNAQIVTLAPSGMTR